MKRVAACWSSVRSVQGGDMESTDMSFLQKLIQKQREATELAA